MATLDVIANAAARPGSPSDGDMYFQTDLQQIVLYDGTATAWKVYTPDEGPYAIDGSNTVSVTPNFHFDAAMINGVDASGNLSNAASLSGVWTSRTNGVKTNAITTAGQQPTYYTSGTNSKPYLSFDGGDYCPIDPFTDKFTADGPFTMFAVGEKGADASGYLSWFGSTLHSGTVKSVYMNFSNGNDYLFFGSTGASVGDRPNIDGSEGTYATTRMWLITRDSSDNGDIWIDGANQNAAIASTTDYPIYANHGGTVQYPMATNGGYGIGDGGYITTGHVYEVAFWNSDLSTADRNKLVAYVDSKYGTGRNADDSGTFARVAFS